MKQILLAGFVLMLFTVSNSNAQNCTQTLRTARQTYEQGRLHEIPTILEECLKGNNFSQTQRVEAYRILVLTYIYLEEPAKADEAMLNLLHTDSFFKVNPAADPIEFQTLYNKFRTAPIFQVGLKFGVSNTQINVLKNHYIWASAAGKGEYSSNVSIQMGLVFEKTLFEKKFKDRLIINPELFYSSSSFNYSNSNISFSDDSLIVSDNDNALFTIAHSRLQTNVMVKYKLFPKSKFAPYVAIGPGFGYLLNSTTSGEVISGSQFTVPEISTKENYKALYLSAILSAGIKYQIGSVFATADIRYQRGLGNVVKSDNRYKPTDVNIELTNYGYVDNDYSINQAIFNVGIIVPYFKPKKLIK
jgi:hypothetical protein